MSENSIRVTNWIAPKQACLPDFIIGGAMKSGTTTLHNILNTHPSIYIPSGEIHFFDIDNILQHSDFNFYDKVNDVWVTQSMEDDPSKMWGWYSSKFEGKENYIIGEDSTTYLASKIAAERIAVQPKEVKMIFILRHPTERAYSHYHHFLRTGRATYTFEDTIRFDPASILERSLYKEQLESYYQLLPKKRIKVILFEELIKDTEEIIKDISEYLGIDFREFNEDTTNTHSNKALTPKNIAIQASRNRLLRGLENINYVNRLPYTVKKPKTSRLVKTANRIHSLINPLSEGKPPKMKESTREFLNRFFIKELSGIDELVGRNILNKWFDVKDM